MKYSKVHTCDFADERVLESGTEFKVCDFDGVKIGIMICYDREYPESARILMLKGAEIILVPNDCVSMRPRLQALSTRAYENMCGVAMANPNGKNAGNSCAFSPICWDDNDECVDIFMALALLPAPKKLKTFTSKPTKNSTKKQKKSCPINGMWKSTYFTSMTEKKEALNFKTWS